MININKSVVLKIFGRVTPVIMLAVGSLLFTECKRSSDKDKILGSEYKPASSDFYVFNGPYGYFNTYSIRNGTVQYPLGTPIKYVYFRNTPSAFPPAQKDSAYFKAKFSKEVSWAIRIDGLTSGAVKTLSGLSDTLTVHNSFWDGSSDGPNFFMDAEKAAIELSFIGSSLIYRDTIIVSSSKYSGLSKWTSEGVKYFLIDDFDGNGVAQFGNPSPDLQDGGSVIYGGTIAKRVNGSKSFRFYGTDENFNTYLLSMSSANLAAFHGNIDTSITPSELYFNIYIYGTGTSSGSVALELYEDDNGNDTCNVLSEDAYIYHALVTWTGWKLVSIPYSHFKKAPDPMAGGSGNNIMEPYKVSAVALSLESYPTPGNYEDIYVDMVCLTERGPFKP